MGEAVAKINAQCHERRSDHRSENGKKIRADVARFVCAERDGHGNRAGTYSKRQGQRIKSAARKTGLPPRGFTIGNRALRISKVLLGNSSKAPPERRV